MNSLLSFLLTLVLVYGYPIIVFLVLIGYSGLPIPAGEILLAAGSLSGVGYSLNIYILIPIVTLTAILGDIIGYFLGLRFGYAVIRLIFRNGLVAARMQEVEGFLKKWGGWCIILTRFLLTPLEVPVNLAAGTSKYPLKRFIVFATLGELIWTSLYVGLGYLFGANWLTLVDYVGDIPLLLALVVIGAGALIIALKIRRRRL